MSEPEPHPLLPPLSPSPHPLPLPPSPILYGDCVSAQPRHVSARTATRTFPGGTAAASAPLRCVRQRICRAAPMRARSGVPTVAGPPPGHGHGSNPGSLGWLPDRPRRLRACAAALHRLRGRAATRCTAYLILGHTSGTHHSQPHIGACSLHHVPPVAVAKPAAEDQN